jgi:hypothetical protein
LSEKLRTHNKEKGKKRGKDKSREKRSGM